MKHLGQFAKFRFLEIVSVPLRGSGDETLIGEIIMIHAVPSFRPLAGKW